jgi:hypothetical protein
MQEQASFDRSPQIAKKAKMMLPAMCQLLREQLRLSDEPPMVLIEKACAQIGIDNEGSLIARATACCEALGILIVAEPEPVARAHQHNRTSEGAFKKVRKTQNIADALAPLSDGGYKSDDVEDAMTDAGEVRTPTVRRSLCIMLELAFRLLCYLRMARVPLVFSQETGKAPVASGDSIIAEPELGENAPQDEEFRAPPPRDITEGPLPRDVRLIVHAVYTRQHAVKAAHLLLW